MSNRKYHPRGVLIDGYPAKKHPLYNTWVLMRQRCMNPNNHAYMHYGGRGIVIDPTWDSFASFVCDMGEKPSAKHMLERKDNNGPYAPWNCVWETRENQMRNRRVFKTSRSGVVGVQPTRYGKFTAHVQINKVDHHIGTFDTIDEAENARQEFIAKQN